MQHHKPVLSFFLKTLLLSITLCALLINIMPAQAKSRSRRFPLGCRDIGHAFEGELLVLVPVTQPEDGPQTMYLIHNISHHPVELQIKKAADDIYKPNYKNVIKAERWGAFAMDYKRMPFTCSTASEYDSGFPISCSQVLEVCQYNRAKFASHNKGNYWIVTSSSRRQAVRGSIDNGILLRS